MDEKISAKAFIAWMVTQPNRNGTLYLERVMRHYVRSLRSVPPKLDLPLPNAERDVFACTTTDEFKRLCQAFTAAPNFKEVNSNSHNFSAGLRCYERYLEHLAHNGDDTIKKEEETADVVDVMEIVPTIKFELAVETKAVDFPSLSVYAGAKPDKCAIECETTTATCWPAMNEGTISPNIDNDTATAIDLVLTERYVNGFRLGSFIETERLRKFVNELLPTPLTLTDDELESIVKNYGTVFGGKVYVVSAETKAKIKTLAEDYFASGATAIFYEAFFAKHEPWLIEASVVSDEELTEVLRRLFPNKQFLETYFGDTRDNIPEVVKRELLRVWGDDVLLNFEMMDKRLMYIPLYRIKQFLGGSTDFIWNAMGEYTHISKIDITDSEKAEFCAFAKNEVGKHGYASLADFPFGEFPENNYELSQTAVHNAVFYICLSDTYERRGKIITRKGDSITAKDIMDEYCRSLDRCSLEDLLDFERELTGESHRWIPMQAGYDNMVRTDKDSFLADKLLDFDQNGVDNAIEHFIAGGEYILLRHITTLAPFPHCGQAWTLFLLESYCRRFSERFRFEVLSVNSTNAGVIVRKYSKLSYHDIMVDAVAKSGVALNQKAVLDFLATEGYTSRRRYTKVTELITQATAKRN